MMMAALKCSSMDRLRVLKFFEVMEGERRLQVSMRFFQLCWWMAKVVFILFVVHVVVDGVVLAFSTLLLFSFLLRLVVFCVPLSSVFGAA